MFGDVFLPPFPLLCLSSVSVENGEEKIPEGGLYSCALCLCVFCACMLLSSLSMASFLALSLYPSSTLLSFLPFLLSLPS